MCPHRWRWSRPPFPARIDFSVQIPASTTKSITLHFSAFANLTRLSMVKHPAEPCEAKMAKKGDVLFAPFDQPDIIPVDIGIFRQFFLG